MLLTSVQHEHGDDSPVKDARWRDPADDGRRGPGASETENASGTKKSRQAADFYNIVADAR